MAGHSSLHLGWLLDVVGASPPGVPVHLKPSGLKAHTAIIAQSGSGKSFMLGRMLEEIAAKTRARIVVLDPNSDFIRFSEADLEAWSKTHLRKWFGPVDTPASFRNRWSKVGFDILTNRESTSLELQNRHAQISSIALSWGGLNASQKARYLDFSMATDPNELYVIHQVNKFLEHKKKASRTLECFVDAAQAIWAKTSKLEIPEEWPVRDFPISEGEVSSSAALNVYGRCIELMALKIWDREGPDKSLPDHITSLGRRNATRRVLCIDLASLNESDERFSVANATLNALWGTARQSWLEALKRPVDRDTRCPTFIVIDEAHNLAPAHAETVLARSVNNILVRIATEGRKYGLFLILVTQRPTRLDPTLLSQCDNLCLMKMNNRIDLDLVESSFGFLPLGWTKRALDFKIGNALLAGPFVDAPICAHVAPRRTAEGGRNLEDKFWLRSPRERAERKSSRRRKHP